MVPTAALIPNLTKRLSWVLSKRKGVAVALVGPPGVGKTWTARQVLAGVPCPTRQLPASLAAGGLLAALPMAPDSPPWVRSALERFARGQATPLAAAGALAAHLVQLAPFILLVEDLHEAEGERLAFWVALAEAVGHSRGVALLVTGRNALPAPFENHAVEPLSPEASALLLEGEAGSALPPEATDWIWRHAQGNPLFTLEYFRHLGRLGYLWSDGQRWRWRPPPDDLRPISVEAVIAQQLQALGSAPEAQALLTAKALLPPSSPAGRLARVSGLSPEALAAWEGRLEAAGVLQGGQFAHPLFREVAFAQARPAERVRLARAALEELSSADPLGAASLLPAAELLPARAREVLEAAVAHARALGDTAQEARLLLRLAELGPEAERFRLTLEAARKLRASNLEEALRVAEAARRLDRHDLEAALLVADLLAGLGRGEEAERLLDGLLERAESGGGGPEERARLLRMRGQVKHLSHDYKGVLELWRQHPEIGLSPVLVARALVQLRRLEDAQDFIARALGEGGLEPFDRAQLLYIQAFIPHFAADYEAAEAHFSAFLGTLEQLDDGSPRYHDLWGGIYQLRAYARNALANPRGAAEDIRAALRIAAEQGNGGAYAFRQSELGLYLLECGEFAQAEEVLLESRGVLERLGQRIYLARLEMITARLYLEWALPHGPALALRHARAGVEHARQAGLPPATVPAVLAGGWAEAVHGRPEAALALADELEHLAHETRQPAFGPAALWVRGLAFERLGDAAGALGLLERAVRDAAPLPMGPHPERMALELDRLRGDARSAHARRERLQRMGLLGGAAVALRYFPDPREAAPPAPLEHRLEVLGTLRFDGQPFSGRIRKGRELLALLLEARLLGRGGVSQLDLIDRLYPELEEEKAVAALKQLVYRLRSALGNTLILRSSAGYALGPVASDAEEFLHGGDLGLWQGPFLPDLDEALAPDAREVLYQNLRARAAEGLQAHPEASLRAARILLEADPYDEAALALALLAQQALGHRKGMHELYRHSRERFLEVGERLPESEDAFLARHAPLTRI